MEKININDYIEILDENTIFLEPRSLFDESIVGFTEDCKHLVYDIELLARSLANSYEESENPLEDALENIDFNILGSMSSLDSDYRPIIMTDGGF